MRAPTRCLTAVVATAAVALPVGCGGKGGSEADKGDAADAAGVVRSFERDLAARDYAQICTEIFSSQVRQQAGGNGCPAFLRRTASSVERPQISIGRVELGRGSAKVHVETSAVGQARVPETIELVRENGRFRIAALSG